tara:strand:+ start:160 stop:1392 length:1233 start_codon:yes stop_codon:yes gene_type:complete
MSDIILHSSTLKYNFIDFNISGSKSISQRALIINALMDSDVKIDNLSQSGDTLLLATALGSSHNTVNVSNSGTTLRFLISFFALKNEDFFLHGDEYLFTRPISQLIQILNSLGANIMLVNNSVIIKKGSLNGGTVYIDSIKTSQFISSLLLIAPYLKDGITLHLPDEIHSHSYIQMTLSMLSMCGACVDYSDQIIHVRQGFYQTPCVSIESDWSSASYLYLAFLFSKSEKVRLNSFLENSIQGDCQVRDFFSLLGVKTEYHDNALVLTKNEHHLNPVKISWEFSQNPDLCPAIFVACVGLGVQLYATGVKNLRHKESNRILSIKTELEKFDCAVNLVSKDVMLINPKKRIGSGKLICIDTYNDHRIALAFSPLALLGFKLKIKNSNVIKKSYPNFFNDLIKFGVLIEKQL